MLDEKKMMKIIVNKPNNPFSLKSNFAVIPNVSYGMFEWGEADLIALTQSGYLIEGEIKISKSDFLKDKEKKKWNSSSWLNDIKRFYYIVPKDLVDFALINSDKGIISIEEYDNTQIVKIEREGIWNKGRKLFIEEQLQLVRLGSMRIWNI